MKTHARWSAPVLFALALAFAACAGNRVRLQEFNADQLFQYAVAQQEAEKWNEAARAFEQFVFQFPTDPRYQEARYRLGSVYYGKKEYLTAAAEFTRLAQDFPSGQYADDARWRICDCYVQLSPRPELDQEYTHTAIQHCNSLISLYPESEFVDTARAVIVKMNDRLAQKRYLEGDHYYRRHAYDSAIMAFEDVLEQYPTSSAAPKALLRLYQSYQKIGYTEEAKAARERLLREFPDSEEARRVRDAAPVPQ